MWHPALPILKLWWIRSSRYYVRYRPGILETLRFEIAFFDLVLGLRSLPLVEMTMRVGRDDTLCYVCSAIALVEISTRHHVLLHFVRTKAPVAMAIPMQIEVVKNRMVPA